MPRQVSTVLKNAIYRSDAGQRVFITLIEISHADLAAPLRFTSDAQDTVSGGQTFVPFPFELALPDENDGVPNCQLRVQNVHRDVVLAIRSVTSEPDFKIWVVLDDDTDRIEAGPWNLKLSVAEYDAFFVTADISGQYDLTREPFPGESYNSTHYPALS